MLAAKRALLDLLEVELALVRPEIDARLGDTGVVLDGKQHNFDPHILSEALHQLRADGLISVDAHLTKGGAFVSVFVPADHGRRRTAIAKSVARKAMLYRRFLKVADTAGEAGELVLRTSMAAATQSGTPYIPVAPRFGEVSALLGHRPYGRLDSAAFLHNMDSDNVPGLPIALPIEVKNRRLTLYPIHKEVHQLLSKAASIQAANPGYPVAPVLICRKAHARLFWMASDLGFRVWATRRQYVFASKDIDARKIGEVQIELGMHDLTVVDRQSPPKIEKFLRTSLPGQAQVASQDWSLFASTIAPYSNALRKDDLTPLQRAALVHELRGEVVLLNRKFGYDPPFTWSASEEEAEDDQEG